MPNGELKLPTPELQSQFESDLQSWIQDIQRRYSMLSPAERASPDTMIKYASMENAAKSYLTQKYQRLASVYETKQQFLLGQLPELYKGYAREYVGYKSREGQLIREELDVDAAARRNLAAMESSLSDSILGKISQSVSLFATIAELTSAEYKQAKEEYEANRVRLGEISGELATVMTYQSLYEGLAAYIQAGKIDSYDDLFSLTNVEGTPITRFQELGRDNKELRAIYDKIVAAVSEVPETVSPEEMSYDEMRALTARLAKKATAGAVPSGPITLHRASVEDIVRVLQSPSPSARPSAPGLPEGITAEEALAMYQKAGVPEELVKELEGLDAYVKDLEEYWEAISSNQAAVRQGLEEAKMPEMGVGDWLLFAIQQPVAALFDVFKLFYHHWVAPWGGMLYRARTLMPRIGGELMSGEKEFLRTYEEAEKETNWWYAGGEALERTELGFADRLLFEWMLEPTTYYGTGILAKVASRVPMLGGRLGIKLFGTVTKTGTTLGIFEKGWLKAWDVLIFDRIKSAGRLIGKTPTQASKFFAGRDMGAVGKYLVHATGGTYYRKISLSRAVELLREARSWAIHHPEDLSLKAEAGRALLRSSVIDEKAIKEFAKKLGAEVDVTREVLLNVSSILNGQVAGEGAQILSKRAAPVLLLRMLGVAESKKSLRVANRLINTLKRQAMSTSDDILSTAKNVPDLLTKIFSHSQVVYLATAESAAAHSLEMSGRIAQTLSKVEWRVLGAWRDTFDRWVVTPAARMYLAFSAYGTGNILEGFIKSMTARQMPFWRSWGKNKPITVVNPSARGQRLMAGLGKPIELEMAIPRIEMAGETPTYLGIERVSKNLSKWRSLLSGGPIGRFFIDLPARVGVHQRWHYYRKMFLTILGEEEATALLQTVAKNVDDAVMALPDDMVRALNLSRGELKSELFERAIAGPASTRSMLDDIVADRIALEKGVSKDVAAADRIAGGRVAEAVGKYPNVPEPFGDVLVQKASDGSLWAKGGRGIDEAVSGVEAGMYDYFVHSPEFYKTRMSERVKELLAIEPRTKEEFLAITQELRDLQRFYSESTDDVIRAMNELETTMQKKMKWHDWQEWRGKYSKEVYDSLADYGDTALKEFNSLTKKLNLLARQPGRGLSTKEQRAVQELLDSWGDEQRFLVDFWKKRRSEELAEIAVMPKGGEPRALAWQKFRANQEKAHAERRIKQAPFKYNATMRESLASEALGVSGPPPPFIDVSGRKLTKMDVATLFHGHASQMPRSLFRIETMTLKSKGDFVIEVKAQAERMARAQGKSADALGWTDDAIGDVYDYVLRDMQISPTAASVMEVHLMELRELQSELHSIYRTKALPTRTKAVITEGVEVEMTQRILQYSHTLSDVRTIASGKGIVKLYHGAPTEFAEMLVESGPKVPYKVEDVARQVAKAYKLSWDEFKPFAYRKTEVIKSFSTAVAPVASRWAQHFPQGEVLSDLNKQARFLVKAKSIRKAGQSLGDAYEVAIQEGIDLAKSKGLKPEAAADALELPDKFILKSKTGALVEIEVDVSKIPEMRQHAARSELDALAKGEISETELLELWNHQYRDFSLQPDAVKSMRIVERDIPQVPQTIFVEESMYDDLQKFVDDLADKIESVPGYATPIKVVPAKVAPVTSKVANTATLSTGKVVEVIPVTVDQSVGTQWMRRIGELDKLGANDREYRGILSTAGKVGSEPEKRVFAGKSTWREEVLRYAEDDLKRHPIAEIQVSLPKAPQAISEGIKPPEGIKPSTEGIQSPKVQELKAKYAQSLTAYSEAKSKGVSGEMLKTYADDTHTAHAQLLKAIEETPSAKIAEGITPPPVKVPTIAEMTPVGRQLSDEFVAAKQRAADKASKEYYKDWADYTNENATTATMRSVYPFWTYELHRLFWLPRASVRQPGVFKAMGTYMDYTEDGYIHIPGTSLEFNLLRGTIFAGGMLRLMRKDYPEYFDMFPEIAEAFDFYSRMGFYPAAYLNMLKLFGGTSAAGRPQFGDIFPAWVKTPLNLYIAAFPKSAPAKFLLDTVLPEPFRVYTTVQVANSICQREQRTFNGTDLWDKMQTGEKLTEEEQDVWTRATQQFGWMGALMEQAAVMRVRTEEQEAMWEASTNFITEVTGYTKEQQLWIRRHGFRVGDYAQLGIVEQAALNELDGMKYHTGTYTHLMPSAWQEEDRVRREFFRNIRDYRDNIQAEQVELDRKVRAGELTVGQWDNARSELNARNANYFKDLSESGRYKDIALEMEDTVRPDGSVREGLISRAEKRGELPPVQHPSEELLNAYYTINLETKFDLESGKYIKDWDGYFLRIDAILNALSGVERGDFIKIITKNYTELEMLRWNVSRKYFRAYNRRGEAILKTQFTPEQQLIIKKWIYGSPLEQDILREVVIKETGQKLISTYQSMTRETGQNLRMLNPELDAWLQFFEITSTTLTKSAASLYLEYRKRYGIAP